MHCCQNKCKALFGHEFYLTVDKPKEANEVTDKIDYALEPKAKRAKFPTSKGNYRNYEYVLPSARTVSDYKHLQASQVECDASIALLNKKV